MKSTKKIAAAMLAAVMTCTALTGCNGSESSLAPAWSKAFGGTDYDTFNDCIKEGSGVVLAGWTESSDGDLAALTHRGYSDGLLTRYNDDGEVEWKSKFGGTDHDVFNAVCETSGGYLAAGSTASSDGDLSVVTPQGDTDGLVVKFDKEGKTVWISDFGGTAKDEFKAIVPTSDGGCVVVGRTASTDGNFSAAPVKGDIDGMIVKYQKDGSTEWANTFGGSGWDEFSSVAVTSDGGFVCVGFTESKDGDLAGLSVNDKRDALIVKFNKQGGLEQQQVFGGTGSDAFNSVCVTKDNGFAAAGVSDSTDGALNGLNQGGEDAVLVKYSSDLSVEFKSILGGTGSETFLDVQPNGSDLVLSGYSNSTDGAFEGGSNQGSYDALLVKFDKSGTLLWKQTLGGKSWDRYNAIAVVSHGNYYVAGASASSDGALTSLGNWGSYDGLLVKYEK